MLVRWLRSVAVAGVAAALVDVAGYGFSVVGVAVAIIALVADAVAAADAI